MTTTEMTAPKADRRGAQVPRRLDSVDAVLRLTLRLWINDLGRSLGSRRRARGVLAGIGAVVLAYTVVVARQMSTSLDQATLGAAATTYAGVMVSVPAVTTILAFVYSPSASLVSHLLVVLPVDRRAVEIATRAMTASVGLGIGLCVTAPLWVPVFVTALVLPGLALVALAVVGALGSAASLHMVAVIGQRVGLRPAMGRGFAALLVSGAVAYGFSMALPMNGNEAHGPHQVISAPLLESALGAAQVVDALFVVALAVAALIVLVLTPPVDQQTSRGRGRMHHAVSAGPRASLTQLELIQMLRFVPNALLLVFVNCLAIGAGLWLITQDSADQLGIGVLLLTLVSAWGVGAYGPTQAHHWLFRTTSRPHAWIAAKLRAVLVIWAAMVSVHGTWLVLGTEMEIRDLGLMLPTMLVELLVGCTVGVLMPVSQNTSISGAISESAAMLILVAVAASMQGLLGHAQSLPQLVLLSAGVVLGALAIYVCVARSTTRVEPSGA